MATAYHFALKKLLGYPKYFSNHIVCAEFGCLTFKHLMNYRFLKLCTGLLNSQSTCLMDLNTFFNTFSYMKFVHDNIFSMAYQTDDTNENDADVIILRLLYGYPVKSLPTKNAEMFA